MLGRHGEVSHRPCLASHTAPRDLRRMPPRGQAALNLLPGRSADGG